MQGEGCCSNTVGQKNWPASVSPTELTLGGTIRWKTYWWRLLTKYGKANARTRWNRHLIESPPLLGTSLGKYG